MGKKLDAVTNFLKETKEVFGILGAAVELLAFFVKMPGWCAIALGILGSLFILIWGWFERKNPSNPLRAVALVAILAGVIILVIFAGSGIILLASEPPSASGILVDEDSKEYSLNANTTSGGLTGEYTLEFKRKADLVEIGVMPASDDLEKVERIDITTRGPVAQTNKMEELINRTNDKQIYYRVTDATPDFKVTLVTTAQTKTASSTRSIKMLVYYNYGMRGPLQGVRSWVFERFGQ